MAFLVPYDGSNLSRAALDRAAQFVECADDDLVALTVVPDDSEFAQDRGWLDPGDMFDVDVVCRKLRREVRDAAPAATFRCEFLESADAETSLTMDLVRVVREVAADVDASVLFVGSENAAKSTTPLASVGSPLAEDPHYDVYVVRNA